MNKQDYIRELYALKRYDDKVLDTYQKHLDQHWKTYREDIRKIGVVGYQTFKNFEEQHIKSGEQQRRLTQQQTETIKSGFHTLSDSVDHGFSDLSHTLTESAKHQSNLIREAHIETNQNISRMAEATQKSIVAAAKAVSYVLVDEGTRIRNAFNSGFKELARYAELIDSRGQALQAAVNQGNLLQEEENRLQEKNNHILMNKSYYQSVEAEKNADNYLQRYKLSNYKDDLKDAFDLYGVAVIYDEFNVSAAHSLAMTASDREYKDWEKLYIKLMSTISAEITNSDSVRSEVAKRTAKRAAMTGSIDLFSKGKYQEFLKFFQFAYEYCEEHHRFYLDFRQAICFFATEKTEAGKKKLHENCKKYGASSISRELKDLKKHEKIILGPYFQTIFQKFSHDYIKDTRSVHESIFSSLTKTNFGQNND